MRSSKYSLGLAVAAACMGFGASTASAATVEVTPADVGPGKEWTKPTTANLGAGQVLFETGPKVTPLGTGSLEFTTTNDPDKANLVTSRYLGAQLSSVTQIGYSTFRDPAATDSAAVVVPSVQIPVDRAGNTDTGGAFSTLVYEPYLAHGNGNIATNTWQDWDAAIGGPVDGGWWVTGDSNGPSTPGGENGGTTCSQGSSCTFAEMKAQLPTAELYGVQLNQGRSNTGGLANADALYVKLAGQDQTTFDFEAEAGPTGPQGGQGIPGPVGATGPQGGSGLTPSSTTTTVRTTRPTISSKSLKAGKNRKVKISVVCARANGLCEGRLNLINKGKTISRTAFNVRGGRTGAVTVTLSKKAYKALKKSQKVKVDVFSRDQAGAASAVTKSLTLTK